MFMAGMLSAILPPMLVVVGPKDSDLVQCFNANKVQFVRVDKVADAIAAATDEAAVLILSTGYPNRTTDIPSTLEADARRRRLSVFVEYPTELPGQAKPDRRTATWERIVATESIGAVRPLDILIAPGCTVLNYTAPTPSLVLARVAGYDQALFGLASTPAIPILFRDPQTSWLIASTRISGVIRGRLAPTGSWCAVWEEILSEVGLPGYHLKWNTAVRPTTGRSTVVTPSSIETAIKRGVEWYRRARMLPDSTWTSRYDAAASFADRVGPAPEPSLKAGDGHFGVLEGFSSTMDASGNQPARWWRRADCTGESAGAFALASQVTGHRKDAEVAQNLGDWLLKVSPQSQADRADPNNPAYGLIGWNDVHHYYGDMDGYGVYYGDDNARALLGLNLAAGRLKFAGWDDRIAQCLLANLRTTGTLGFREDRIDQAPLLQRGWRSFFEASNRSYAPHYQAYLWACYLWAYAQGGDKLFLNRAENAIRVVMQEGEPKWRWTNGIQQERGRMLLPLAWLVRVSDTPEHRAWLDQIVQALISQQDPSGAIPEQLGSPSSGMFAAARSNAEYGLNEAPLIQQNGDPATDLLYTCNFILLGLHEAVAATGRKDYAEAERKLADYVVRIQIRSETHPELDGAWFRAFDFRRWEFWASNGDAGWGAWSIESGWTQAWLVSVLAMRSQHLNLWDASRSTTMGIALRKWKPKMIPSEPSNANRS